MSRIFLALPILACILGACAQQTTTTAPSPVVVKPPVSFPDVFHVQKKLGPLPAATDTSGLLGWFTQLENLVLNPPDLQAAATLASGATPPDTTAAQCFSGLIPVRAQVDGFVTYLTGLLPIQPGTTTPPPPLPVAFEELRLLKNGIGSTAGGIKAQLDGIRVAVNNACGALFVDTNAGIVDPLSLFSGG